MSEIRDNVDMLHATFNRALRSKDITTTPSQHEKDFGEFVAKRFDNTDSDWKRVTRFDGAKGFMTPAGDDVSAYVKDWVFAEGDLKLLRLAVSMARVAEDNGISKNEFIPLFTVACRMLKVEGDWSN